MTDFNICQSIVRDRPAGLVTRRPLCLRPVCLPSAALLKRGVSSFLQESSLISRYARPEMTSIWGAQTPFKIWFEIEAHATDAMARSELIPKEVDMGCWTMLS